MKCRYVLLELNNTLCLNVLKCIQRFLETDQYSHFIQTINMSINNQLFIHTNCRGWRRDVKVNDVSAASMCDFKFGEVKPAVLRDNGCGSL